MLSISPKALDLLRARHEPVYLDLGPHVRAGCCLRAPPECPAVRFGVPPDLEHFAERSIQGVTVFVPRAIDAQAELQINVWSFLGLRRFVLDGWRPL